MSLLRKSLAMALDQLCGRETSDDAPTYRPPPKCSARAPATGSAWTTLSRAAAVPMEREIKRLKMPDLEFANEALTPDGGSGGPVSAAPAQGRGAGGGGGEFRKGRRR